jgi:hypothetical protein
MNDEPLEALFLLSSLAYEKMVKDGFLDDNERIRAIEATELAMSKVNSESLFSKNEVMDDTSTNHIKYRYLPFYCAMITQKCMEPSARLTCLVQAKQQLLDFIHNCESLELVHPDDLNMLKEDEVIPYY